MDQSLMKALNESGNVVTTLHFMQRITTRSISLSDVRSVINEGEIIEDYPDDYLYPSCLISGHGLHVVAGVGGDKLWLITAYRPEPSQWDNDGKTRKVIR